MGTVEARLAALVEAAPDEATVPVGWIRRLLAEQGSGGTADPAESRRSRAEPAVDLTVTQVADLFARGHSTVRGWLTEGRFANAYRLHGREWRIPRSDVEAMQQAERDRFRAAGSRAGGSQAGPAEATDLSAWRNHVPRRTG